MYFYIFVFHFPHPMCFRSGERKKKGPEEFERGKKASDQKNLPSSRNLKENPTVFFLDYYEEYCLNSGSGTRLTKD